MRVQLKPPKRPTALRDALHTAAIAMLLVPAAAKADGDTTDQIDFTSLLYGEASRTQVVEPIVRYTHLLPDGASVSAQLGIDVMTGASPTGALPDGTVQTHTSASGRVTTSNPGATPLATFQDHRFAIDAEWQKPFFRLFTSTVDGHVSREKDYQSLGVSGTLSTDLIHRTLTLTLGGGVNHDSVFPVGGTPDGLTDGTILNPGSNGKDVKTFLLGVSQILNRHWMVAVDGSKAFETGYLTEPYKLISVLDPVTGVPITNLTDKRPTTRDRSSVLLSSVYHFTDDVLYASYRYYWDTWNVRSNTLDVRYRHDLDNETYVEPLFRFYKQTAASFYTIGLVEGVPLPDFATADYRLGDLQTITLGGTWGFRWSDSPADWTVRAQYMRQSGDSSPPGAIGIQRTFDLFPTINIVSVVIGYSFGY